jgi:hypothetical protein
MLAVAWWSDRIGRRPLGLAAAALAFVGALPLFWMMHHDSSGPDLPRPDGLRCGHRHVVGVLPSILVESISAGVRCTLIALDFNITMGVIGGVTPLVATWLVARTHDDLSPAYPDHGGRRRVLPQPAVLRRELPDERRDDIGATPEKGYILGRLDASNERFVAMTAGDLGLLADMLTNEQLGRRVAVARRAAETYFDHLTRSQGPIFRS